MNESTQQPKVPIHPSQAELTITTADDWLHDQDDEASIKLKQDLDAQLIAADTLQSQQNQQYDREQSYRGMRGHYRGNRGNRGNYRGNYRGNRGHRTNYRGNYRGNRGNYHSNNRYNKPYNKYTDRSTYDNNYNNHQNNDKYDPTHDEYGNKIYSTKTNRGERKTYRRTGGRLGGGRGRGRRGHTSKLYTKNEYFAQKRKQYDTNRKFENIINATDFVSTYPYYNENTDANTTTLYGATTATTSIYTQPQPQPPQHPLDFSAVNQQYNDNGYEYNKKKRDRARESTPETPTDLVLNNMRHAAFLGSDYELNPNIIMQLVREAIANHQKFYRPLIDMIESMGDIGYDEICIDIGQLVADDYENNTRKLRIEIIKDKFGKIVYGAIKQLYIAQKQEINNYNYNHSHNHNHEKYDKYDRKHNQKVAYVTYCLPKDDAFIMCCCALGAKLQGEGCKYERVLMLPYECFEGNNNNKNKNKNNKLLDVYAVFLQCWDICLPIDHSDSYPYYYCKLHAFSLINYDKIMFIEPYAIVNDDQLEIYYSDFPDDMIPCAPRNNNYEVMVLKPNKNIFDTLYNESYNCKQKLKCEQIKQIISAIYKWHTIQNETDKDEWFLNVKQADVETATTHSEQSFVIAYFVDSNPWDIYKELGMQQACKCIAIRIWMETAWNLLRNVPSIGTLVNPEILKIIDPKFDGKDNERVVVDDDDKKQKEMGNGNDNDNDSDNAPSPPPQYYDKKRKQENENKNKNQQMDDDKKEEQNDEDLTGTDTEEEDNALKPRDIDDDD